MGLTYNTYLDGKHVYGCKNCKAHLANHEDIISRVSPLSLLPSSHFISPYPPPPPPKKGAPGGVSSPLSPIPALTPRRTSAASTARPTSSTPSSTSTPASPATAA